MRIHALFGLIIVVGLVAAQEPGLLPSTIPLPMPEEGVVPAQFVQPTAGTSVRPNPTANAIPVPVVQLDVIVPQSAASAVSIPCKVVVRNNSNADAYSVIVRIPMGRLGATTMAETVPIPFNPLGPANKNVTWKYSTLRAGESKTITFELKPDAATGSNGELGLKAFVSFEHGVEVLTKLGTPKLILDKSAPKEAATGETIPVSLQIRNSGTVPLHDVKLTETLTTGFLFAEGSTGEETKDPRQRTWKLGTLQAGETRPVGYRVTAKQAGELLTSSAVTCAEGNQVTKEAAVKVMSAGLAVTLAGPRESSPGEPAVYSINVRNTGDLAMRNVRVTGTIPDGCRATKMTNGGRMSRDRIDWIVPELKPGGGYDVRFALVGDAPGKRTVSAIATDQRGKDYSDTRETTFAASADLHWESFADPTSIAIGKTGAFTVRVKNTGGDAARNVVVKMELPAEIRRTTIRPKDAKEGGREIVFKAETIPPGTTRDYIVEFKAEQAGRAYFQIKLESDSLGDKPMIADKMIVVTQSR